MPTAEPTEQPPQSPQPPQPPTQRRLEPLSADRFGVHFTADTEFRDLLERVRALASHRLPGGDLKTVLQRGLEAYERELLKSRFKVGKPPRAPERAKASAGKSATPNPKACRSTQRQRSANRSRYVAAATAREVYARDHRQCTFVSSDGYRCGVRQFLQLDHIDPRNAERVRKRKSPIASEATRVPIGGASRRPHTSRFGRRLRGRRGGGTRGAGH